MSSFGDYIHATWSGYYQHGTHRFNSNQSNFSQSIFDEHYNILRDRLTSESIGLDKETLEKLENEYNTNQSSILDQVKKLIANKNRGTTNQNILIALVQSLNAQWNTTIATQIVNALKWDETKQTLIYAPSTNAHSLGYKSTQSSLPRVASWDPKSKAHFVNRLYNSIEKLKTALGQDPYKNAFSSQDKATLNNFLKILQKQSKIANKLQEEEIHEALQGSIYSLAKIHEEANAIRFNYSEIEQINEILRTQFAEFVGNNIGTILTAVAKQKSVQQITEAFKSTFIGRGSGSNASKPNYKIVTLNFKEIEAQLKNDPSIATIINEKGSRTSAKGNSYVAYEFSSMGDPRAQKADIIASLTLSSGQKENFGISMKNISLKQGDIKAQDSSLMLYLLGASDICSDASNMGTHYLNIMSKHGNEGNGAEAIEDPAILNATTTLFEQMREQAYKTLSLHILYSALSGYGQLRNQQQGARILAIYDKDSYDPSTQVNRVHFFSIPAIVEKLWEDDQIDKTLSPAPRTILFQNPYEEEYEDFPRRLTNVLIEARQINIKAIIRASLLRSLTS